MQSALKTTWHLCENMQRCLWYLVTTLIKEIICRKILTIPPKKEKCYAKVLAISELYISLSSELSMPWPCYFSQVSFQVLTRTTEAESALNITHLRVSLGSGGTKHRSQKRPVFGWIATEEGPLSLMEERVQFHPTAWKAPGARNSTQNCNHQLCRYCTKEAG